MEGGELWIEVEGVEAERDIWGETERGGKESN